MASCTACCGENIEAASRRKTLQEDMITTKLHRCLKTFDLVFMGIGYMVGTGIFVLSGEVIRNEAGASTMLSFLIAGIAAMLSAMCYAEFSALVPLAGSSYTYTYVILGEMWAFLVGWNLVLEYIIMAASSAKSWSGTLDELCNGAISTGISEYVGTFPGSILSAYPDFIAAIVVILVTVFVLCGPMMSSNFNKVMVVFKLITIALIIVVGFVYADTDNWSKSNGGFAPYGISGVFTGAATCFFAYVGFDGLAIASEETVNPRKTVPISILVSLVIVTILYIISSVVLSLLVPFYDVNPLSPFTSAFEQLGVTWVEYAVGVGTLFGLTSVTMGGIFSLPRIIFAMARDGLLFESFAHINLKTQTPIVPIVTVGVSSMLLAFFLNLDVLVDLLSIGTLFSFTFVSASVVIIRYDPPDVVRQKDTQTLTESEGIKTTSLNGAVHDGEKTPLQPDHQLKPTMLNRWKRYADTKSRSNIVILMLLMYTVSTIVFVLFLLYCADYVAARAWWAILILILSVIGHIIPLYLIHTLGQRLEKQDTFQVPLVPFLPGLSIFCNVGLMLMLDWTTWLRLAIWIVLGLIIYFTYGARHSLERNQQTRSEYIEFPPGQHTEELHNKELLANCTQANGTQANGTQANDTQANDA